MEYPAMRGCDDCTTSMRLWGCCFAIVAEEEGSIRLHGGLEAYEFVVEEESRTLVAARLEALIQLSNQVRYWDQYLRCMPAHCHREMVNS